jgi:hypothetical protein
MFLFSLNMTTTEGAPSSRSLQEPALSLSKGWEPRTCASWNCVFVPVRGAHPCAQNAQRWGTSLDALHAKSACELDHPPFSLIDAGWAI